MVFSCSKDGGDGDPIPDQVNKYTLIISSSPTDGGSITPSSGTYNEGTVLNLMATPAADYVFMGWTGTVQSTDNPLRVTMNSDMNITALFEELTNLTYVPDDFFEIALIQCGYDDVLDDYVYTDVIEDIDQLFISSKNIRSLEGIEDFANLEILHCNNNQLSSLDVSNNEKLKILLCENNALTQLDVSANKMLEALNCYYNPITLLNVSGAENLVALACYGNELSNLDISNNLNLERLI